MNNNSNNKKKKDSETEVKKIMDRKWFKKIEKAISKEVGDCILCIF